MLAQSMDPTPSPSLGLTKTDPENMPEHAGTSRGQALIGREGRGPLGDKAPTQHVSSRNKSRSWLKSQWRGVSSVGCSWTGRVRWPPSGISHEEEKGKFYLHQLHGTPDWSRRMSTGQGIQKLRPSKLCDLRQVISPRFLPIKQDKNKPHHGAVVRLCNTPGTENIFNKCLYISSSHTPSSSSRGNQGRLHVGGSISFF